eukprot:TRINITY_DN8517_c0_g1_i3.p1 TRINITY_DN8517_c0_g1~~TRINITY_DN8517_c0_g1_i3.p1  ORF type:complete len:964 (-),score=235.04 TRINITY_DN8517_c0_g1_i3:277-3168(-)
MLAELSEEVGRKLSHLQEEIADVRSHTSERFVRVVEDVSAALDDLRGTAFDLGVQLQASQHDVADFQRKTAEAERRALETRMQLEEQCERSCLELRQQLSELRLAVKAGTEQCEAQHKQQSDAITRQSGQLALQLQDCKDLMKGLISCSIKGVKDDFLDQLMKLRIVVEEQERSTEASFKAKENDAQAQRSELHKLMEDRIEKLRTKVEEQERSTVTSFKAMERDAQTQRSELQRLVEDRIEKAGRQDARAQQEQELRIRQEIDTTRSAASDAQLQVGKATQEMEARMQKTIETVRLASAEGLRQLGKTVHEAEILAKTRHDEVIARQAGLQAQVNEIRAAELALANDAAQGLESAWQRLAEKLRSEVQTQSTSLQEAKDASRVALDKLRADIDDTLRRRDAEHSDFLKVELRTAAQNTRSQESKILQTLSNYSREASDVAAELRKRTDVYAEKAAIQLREVQASFQALVTEAKAETQQQFASEKRNMAAEIELSQEKRLRELSSLVERERLRSEDLRQNAQALFHDNSRTLRASIEDSSEKLIQRLQQHEDSARQALSVVSERIANQQALADKNNGRLREEISNLSSRLEEARQSHCAEFKRLDDSCRMHATIFSELEKARQKQVAEMERQHALADKNNGRFREDISNLSSRLEEARQLHCADINRLDDSCRIHATELEKARHQHVADMERQQAMVDKNNGRLLEDISNLSSRLEESRQLHFADVSRLDDSCRMYATNFGDLEKARHQHAAEMERMKACHEQLHRRVQAKEERLQSIEVGLSTCKDEWKSQHAELEAACRMQRDQQKEAVDKVVRRQDRVAEALSAAERKQEKQTADLAKTELQTEKCVQALDNLGQTERRVAELEDLTGGRLIDAISEQMQALVHRELKTFQHDALSVVEWKIERCVQWLHGASVKLGLNPSGTMFHADRLGCFLLHISVFFDSTFAFFSVSWSQQLRMRG